MSDKKQDFDARRRKRRLQRGLRRLAVLLVAMVVLLGFAWLATSFIQRSGESGVKVVPPQAPKTPQSVAQPRAESLPEVEASAWNVVAPVQQSSSVSAVVTPDSRMLALPENGRVDMSYFDTVTFVGDSITQGLETYKTIPNAKYCAYKGVGPKQIYDGSIQKRRISPTETQDEIPMEALVASAPANIYILLGTNAMVGMDDESLLAYYSEMLDSIRAALGPAVGIYVQSITPVLEGTERFDIARIHGLNNALARITVEKDMYFLDLHEALAGEDGYLRPEYGASKDGYHLTPTGYRAWLEYLLTHTAGTRPPAEESAPAESAPPPETPPEAAPPPATEEAPPAAPEA